MAKTTRSPIKYRAPVQEPTLRMGLYSGKELLIKKLQVLRKLLGREPLLKRLSTVDLLELTS